MATKKTDVKKTNSTRKKQKNENSKNKKSKSSRRTKKTNTRQSVIIYELKLIALITFTIILIASLHSNAIGIFGLYAKNTILGLFSRSGYIFPYVFFAVIFFKMNSYFKKVRVKYILGSLLLFLAVLIVFSSREYEIITEAFKFKKLSVISFAGMIESFKNGIQLQGGGALGNVLSFIMINFFGLIGTYIIAFCMFIGTFILFKKKSFKQIVNDSIEKKQIKKSNKVVSVKSDESISANQINKARANAIKSKNSDENQKIINLKKVTELPKLDPRYFKDSKNISDIAKQDVVKQDIQIENDEIEMDEIETKPEIKLNTFNRDKDIEVKTQNIESKNIETEKVETGKVESQPISKAEEKKIIETMDNSQKSLYEDYVMPSVELLNINKDLTQTSSKKYLLDNAKTLEETLNNFGVSVKVTQVTQGPSITMYELQPSVGVKISKIMGLSDDIALNLAVSHVRVAPIVGKVAIGIEVPNKDTSMVMMRDVIETKEFEGAKSKLSFVLGKNISGKPIIGDLSKMPHLLIAGATGSGKSVCVNTIINSILFNATPDEVKLLMIDPKVVELNNYNGIPHLILPVVTDPKKAAIALNWGVTEMTRRYQLFAENGVKDMKGYNQKAKKFNAELQTESNSDENVEKPAQQRMEILPQIVIIIDELADLMMVAANAVEDAICRLAQMARAAGLHLIVATQRPSVDVITGVIKANIPSRIAFAVSSQTDSRTIIDMGGAEKLLGKGDMLYYPVGEAKPIRVQGAFLSEEEINRVVEFVKIQSKGEEYREEILDSKSISSSRNDEYEDEYLKDAIQLVVQTQSASASMLQRKFRIGYNRAGRLMDEMEERGIVGASQGSKAREVLITLEELNGEVQET